MVLIRNDVKWDKMGDPIISAACMRVVNLLAGKPPQSVADLTKMAKVTRTAVMEQLGELVAAGLVEQTTERLPGRGRPRHLYSMTNAAMGSLFPDNRQLVVPAMWQAIDEAGGPKLRKKVLRSVSQSLAEHYKKQITAKTPIRRFRELIELLRKEGVLVEASEQNGRLVLRKRSCPFISMLDEHHSVCYIDQNMMSEIVGRPIRQTECRHDGDPCCAFEIADAK